MRNICALWAKDLGLNELQQAKDKNDLESKPNLKNSIQDIKTHEYLQSLANFIEVERVTLLGFLH